MRFVLVKLDEIKFTLICFFCSWKSGLLLSLITTLSHGKYILVWLRNINVALESKR